jgi:hypothetical protein
MHECLEIRKAIEDTWVKTRTWHRTDEKPSKNGAVVGALSHATPLITVLMVYITIPGL